MSYLPFTFIRTASTLRVSQWADDRRILNALTSAEPGKWRTSRTPYLREPMDAFTDKTVDEIIVQSSTQVGKTELILNCLGYVADVDPAPTMIVLPREEDAKDWAFKRVKPMIDATPCLRDKTTGVEDDIAGKLYQLINMFIKFTGANSPAGLASDACRFVFFDEVNKYPKFSGREANPIKLGQERQRTFWNKKTVKVSTPTLSNGAITLEMKRSDNRRYYMPCPRCGVYQPLAFSPDYPTDHDVKHGAVRWPKGATADDIRERELAWYECGSCTGRIDHHEKEVMLARGVWCPKGAKVTASGALTDLPKPTSRRGYQFSALYSPWVTWSEIAAEFLECKSDISELMSFINSVLGEAWEEKAHDTTADYLRTLSRPIEPGYVPQEAVVLTAGIDKQKDCYWFVVRAWGVGEESWLIRYGRVQTKEELRRAILETSYQVAGVQTVLPVRLACMDSGYDTNEVYAFCRLYRDRMRPIKGYDRIQSTPYRATGLDKDSKGKPIASGFSVWTIDTTYYKDKLNRHIHTPPGSPGAWHLYEAIDDEYTIQLSAEHKITLRDKKTGKKSDAWALKKDSLPNHLLDCEVYAMAAAEMLKVYLLTEPGSGTVVYRPVRRMVHGGYNV